VNQGYSQAKQALIESFVREGIYTRDDLSWLLSVYYQDGRLDDRVALLRKGIELFPDEHAWYNDLGYTLLVKGGDMEEAAALIFAALGMDPTNPFYLDSIAWYYYLKGDYQHAKDFITGAMEMENMPSEIAYHIALIYLKLNDFTTATVFMGRAAEGTDDPNYNDRAVGL
jgi:Flp pilus assembly protein TadD